MAKKEPAAYSILGAVYLLQGNRDEAAAACRKAIKLNPKFSDAHLNLGNVMISKALIDDAIVSYRQAVSTNPRNVAGWNNLGNALLQRGKTAEAGYACRQALNIDPKFANAWNCLGNVLKDIARVAEAVEAYRRAVSLNPGSAVFLSNLIYYEWFLPNCDPHRVMADSTEWARRHADPITRTGSAAYECAGPQSANPHRVCVERFSPTPGGPVDYIDHSSSQSGAV